MVNLQLLSYYIEMFIFMILHKCLENYQELVGERIPFARFGFPSVEALMRALSDTVRITRLVCVAFVLFRISCTVANL